ncbi:zinc metalloproteinase nas-4 [Hydra vulgaris]|uniref:Metalloendopeptidase n=1 Tax=Hydra vulgaris TaxID=6087 RepID=A0ABM4CN17_HYDVU
MVSKNLIFGLSLLCVSVFFDEVKGRRLSAVVQELLKLSDSFENDSINDRGQKQPDINNEDLPNNGELFEGDIVMDENIRRAVLGYSNKKSADINSKEGGFRHWKDGIVPYTFHKSLVPVIRERINDAIKEFNLLTCVRYVPKNEFDRDYVTFRSLTNGCSSSVGKQGGEQFINLGIGCRKFGTVMHEMMHTIGIIHEQSRPDRNQYIDVLYDNIKPKLLHNFRMYSLRDADNLDVPYNYWSVMHYNNFAFSSNGKKTLVSKLDKTLNFGQRYQLTYLDVMQINKLYPGCQQSKVDYSDADFLVSNMTPHDVLKQKDEEASDMLSLLASAE